MDGTWEGCNHKKIAGKSKRRSSWNRSKTMTKRYMRLAVARSLDAAPARSQSPERGGRQARVRVRQVADAASLLLTQMKRVITQGVSTPS
eukprot:5979308-Prymnesium_polylepis.1